MRTADGRLVVEGYRPPPIWVGPVIAGVVVFGLMAWAIATGLCFSCAEPGATWWPLVVLVLVATYGRGFRLQIDAGRVLVEETYLGLTFRRLRGHGARITDLPDYGAARFGAAVMMTADSPLRNADGEVGTEITVLLGHPQTAKDWMPAVRSHLKKPCI